MKTALQKVRRGLNTKLGFFLLTVLLFAIKSYWAYKTKFNLGISDSMQQFLLAFNTLPGALVFLGIALYFRGRLSYWLMILINFLLSTWLFANILYYREFSDFITFNIIKGSGAASNNLGKSLMGIIKPTDFLVYADVIILIVLLAAHFIRIDMRYFKVRYAMTITMIGFVLFGANLAMAEKDRPQLLTRTFDNNYIVKYLGLQAYTIYDGVKTTHNSAVKAKANSNDIKPVLKFLKKNYASPNIEYYGQAKGKNIIIIHLESFQQFMIDYKWKGEEVTPNLNKLYHASDTISFDNFFNQVGQGKTADAELMLENSLYGLPEGSAMVTDGTTNTFQSAPALLEQKLGYTTASFHGDVPSFWNRDNAYKSFGYQYFFSKDYLPKVKDEDMGYGVKDKLFLKESAYYLEQLPQPFYAKLITVSNHYRISNNHKAAIAQILGKKSVDNYDLAMFQKVPFMINMEGLKGGVNHTYGGEIDVLPTIEDLLGISSNKYVQFGQDLLSKNRNQIVPFRNGDWVTNKYTKYNGDYYYTSSGKEIKSPTKAQKAEFAKIQKYVTTDLGLSDKVVNGDLLRFYKLKGFKTVNKKSYSYTLKNGLKQLKQAQKKSKTSLKSQNNNQSTLDQYTTDAPELKGVTLKFPTK